MGGAYKAPVAAPTKPATPVLEPGMAGYGGITTVPGMPGSHAGQGGYTDAAGGNHSYSSPQGQAAYTAISNQFGASNPQKSPFDSDPGVYGARAAEQLGIPTINTDLSRLIAQRIAAYGDPSFAAQAGFGLDPQAAAFARQNYLSGNGELARIDRQHELQRRAIINQLAAHGLIDSGETGYQVGNADQTYGNQVYDAQQKLLSDLFGYQTSAVDKKTALHTALIDALHNAYQFGVDHPDLYATPQANPPLSSPPAVTSTKPPAAPKAPSPKKNPVLSALAARSAGLNKKYGLG